MTPHNEAKLGDIAKNVLMPGDPLRAKFIAEAYLTDYKLVNTVRNMYAYTGYYKNVLVTIMASGMGIPSIGIYSYELYDKYNVENIIRIGSMGAYTDKLKLYDTVLVTDSYSLSSYAKTMDNYTNNIIESSNSLNNIIEKVATNLNKKLIKGRIYSSDCFYDTVDIDDLYSNKKCIGVEMESFGLFYNAYKLNKKAACLLTVSDNLITKEETSSKERENAFKDMIEIALNTVINL